MGVTGTRPALGWGLLSSGEGFPFPGYTCCFLSEVTNKSKGGVVSFQGRSWQLLGENKLRR